MPKADWSGHRLSWTAVSSRRKKGDRRRQDQSRQGLESDDHCRRPRPADRVACGQCPAARKPTGGDHLGHRTSCRAREAAHGHAPRSSWQIKRMTAGSSAVICAAAASSPFHPHIRAAGQAASQARAADPHGAQLPPPLEGGTLLWMDG